MSNPHPILWLIWILLATSVVSPAMARSSKPFRFQDDPAVESATESSIARPEIVTETSTNLTDAAAMQHGFLPTRGSVMLDFVFLAMIGILPVLSYSIYLAGKRKFELHRNIQIATAIALLAAVVLFEVDMRFFTDWRELARPSSMFPWCTPLLYFHLLFAVPAPFVWAWVIYGALRNLDANFQGDYVVQHRLAGKIGAWLMYATGMTGILFYVVAFIL